MNCLAEEKTPIVFIIKALNCEICQIKASLRLFNTHACFLYRNSIASIGFTFLNLVPSSAKVELQRVCSSQPETGIQVN